MLVKWLEKKGNVVVLFGVDSTERESGGSGSVFVFGWTLRPVSPVTQLGSDLQTTDG